MTEHKAIYVAPQGLDSNAGTEEQPVRTLFEAISRTREAGPELPKRVILRGGNYYDVCLRLTSADEGLSIEAYPGEQPVLHGGVPVTAWQREGDWLTAPVPGVRDRRLDFRAIEVDGRFRQRSRLPEAGAFRHFNEFKVEWLSTFAGGWARKPTTEEMMSIRVKREDVGTWLDVHNAELTIYHEWDESLVGVDAVKEAEQGVEITFKNAPGHPPGAFFERNENARTYVVWNVKEGMKRPGQWYLDRTNEKLVYWPLPGEEADHIHVVIPRHEHLLVLETGAHRIRLQGLTFSSAATQLSAGGFGALSVSAAIHGEEVSEIEFERVTVRNTGGWAFKLNGKGIRLHDCHIHHTGAGGIQWSGERIQLERSRIHDIGMAYLSAIAINSDGTDHAITQNEIYNTPYSGIASSSPNSVIQGNLLYDTMSFMKDGSAIYVCWYSDNVNVSGNAVFGRLSGGEAGSGPSAAHEKVRRYAYYLDEKCTNCAVTGNLAVNLGVPMLSHMTKDCKFANNIFMDRGLQTVSVLNSFGVAFERNILIADAIEIHSPKGNPGGLVSEEYDSHPYMSAYSKSDGITSLRNNLFYSRSGRQVFKHYFHYKPIEVTDLEQSDGNGFGDPMVTDAAAGDFGYAAKSPAWQRGIEPLSFADAGCEGRFAEIYKRCMNGSKDPIAGE
ncbi:right-handed parallel beta-helix repeat-containing protein [Paenibacillus montanisoli]|uniref:Uncharacterized protein n=1 Tax=Paenibacillus montanisoli TaxID=2081970 RepID=A0A328U056_9BACL|nr:right-handed parallel beta-helix repeat-containing protein [Paenibacillus montanisoli]RAP76069.1 hypothetical protein DL346_11635 [Paenibacillus montanisoli]